jgi:hypothetical protein
VVAGFVIFPTDRLHGRFRVKFDDHFDVVINLRLDIRFPKAVNEKGRLLKSAFNHYVAH